MRYLIAVDSGGTKTNTILFDETGHILHREVFPGGNPLDIGIEKARDRFMEAMRTVIPMAPGPVEAIYAALAGVDYYDKNEVYPPELLATLGVEKIHIEDDGICMMSSELYHGEDGVSVVCGTGCSSWVRKKELSGPVHIGGWGYLLDAQGSGYHLGRNALHAACLASDGRGPETVLVELIEKNTGKPFKLSVPDFYAGGRSRIASLAYTVFEGAKRGDEISKKLMQDGIDDMVSLIWGADTYFDKPYPVVIGGGIVTAFPEYAAAIRAAAPDRVTFILAEAPPVFGAAAEAMRDCGVQVDQAFREQFLKDYRVWEG